MKWEFLLLTLLIVQVAVLTAVLYIFCRRFLDKLDAVEDYVRALPDQFPVPKCNFPEETKDDKPFVQPAPQWGEIPTD